MSARYFWTMPETAIVRGQYPVAGVEACLAQLPHRTRGAIYQQAFKLGLRCAAESKRGRPRQRYRHDVFSDAAILETYRARPTKNAVNRLAQRLGKPRWWVYKRAIRMGLTVPRFAEPAWSEAEIELLAEHSHKNLDVISRILRKHGFKRTPTAIRVKQKRMQIGVTAARREAGIYSANQIAALLGIDRKGVTRWIHLGYLDVAKRGTAHDESRDHWEVTTAALRRFIVAHPECIDLRKVDKLWFIELLGRAAA